MSEWNQVVGVLGRREGLKYLALGVMGVAVTPLLTACNDKDDEGEGGGKSVAAKSLKAFASGTWEVTFPLDPDEETFTITVGDGTWQRHGKGKRKGAWTYVSGSLQVSDWSWDGTLGKASDVPAAVDEEQMPGMLMWAYAADGPEDASPTELQVPIEWDRKKKQMTFKGKSAEGQEMLIRATKNA